MSFGAAVSTCFSKYLTFSGRARRSEYWWFALLFGIVYVAALVLYGALTSTTGETVVSLVALLAVVAVLLPLVAVAVRRLHDTGRSGWWYLVGLVPFIGGIVLLIFFIEDSQPGTNRHGPCPKALGAPMPFATPYQ